MADHAHQARFPLQLRDGLRIRPAIGQGNFDHHVLAGAHAQQGLFGVHLRRRAKNDSVHARLGNGFRQFSGDMTNAVLVGSRPGGVQVAPHQRHDFDIADELHRIQMLLPEGARAGKNDFHHVFSSTR